MSDCGGQGDGQRDGQGDGQGDGQSDGQSDGRGDGPAASVWAQQPGAGLLAACDAVLQRQGGAGAQSDSTDVDALTAFARFEAWAAAGKVAIVARLYARSMARLAGSAAAASALGQRCLFDESDVHDEVSTEVALALGISRRSADGLINFALDLTAHPALHSALSAGRLDRIRAQAILTEVAALDDPVDRARVVAALVGSDPAASAEAGDASAVEPEGGDIPLVRELQRPGASLWQIPVGRLRSITVREVHRIDSEAIARRAQAARAERRVWQRPVGNAMGELTLHTGVEQATGCWRSLDDAARAAKASGDRRSLDQLRADIAVHRLALGTLGGLGQPAPEPTSAAAAPGVLINLTIPARSYVGLSDESAILHGPSGPIPLPADLARALADRPDGAFLRRVLTDPATGVAWDVSRSYRPPAAMAAFVQARDGYRSRLPVSGATRMEIDHIEPWVAPPADGRRPGQRGPTTPGNLQSLGHRDHQTKTRKRLVVQGNANGILTLITPAGKRYLSYPESYHDPWSP